LTQSGPRAAGRWSISLHVKLLNCSIQENRRMIEVPALWICQVKIIVVFREIEEVLGDVYIRLIGLNPDRVERRRGIWWGCSLQVVSEGMIKFLSLQT